MIDHNNGPPLRSKSPPKEYAFTFHRYISCNISHAPDSHYKRPLQTAFWICTCGKASTHDNRNVLGIALSHLRLVQSFQITHLVDLLQRSPEERARAVVSSTLKRIDLERHIPRHPVNTPFRALDEQNVGLLDEKIFLLTRGLGGISPTPPLPSKPHVNHWPQWRVHALFLYTGHIDRFRRVPCLLASSLILG